MPPTGPNPYLRTKILTASPQELRMMLYEGAVRFCRQALAAMEKKDYETSFDALLRTQKIVLELSTSMKHEVAPDLCAKLTALYNYIHRLLVEASVQRNPKPVTEALSLLEYEAQTWRLLMEKLAQDPAAAGQHAAVTAPQQTAISSLSRSA